MNRHVIILLLAIGATSAAVLARQVRGDGDVKTIDVTASRFQFEPATISVAQGDSVRLGLHSADRSHAFAIKAFRVKALIPKGRRDRHRGVRRRPGRYVRLHVLGILRHRPFRDEGQAGRPGEGEMMPWTGLPLLRVVFRSPAGPTQHGSRCV